MRGADADNGGDLLRRLREGDSVGHGDGMPGLVSAMRLTHCGRRRETLAEQRAEFGECCLPPRHFRHRFAHGAILPLPHKGSTEVPRRKIVPERNFFQPFSAGGLLSCPAKHDREGTT